MLGESSMAADGGWPPLFVQWGVEEAIQDVLAGGGLSKIMSATRQKAKQNGPSSLNRYFPFGLHSYHCLGGICCQQKDNPKNSHFCIYLQSAKNLARCVGQIGSQNGHSTFCHCQMPKCNQPDRWLWL